MQSETRKNQCFTPQTYLSSNLNLIGIKRPQKTKWPIHRNPACKILRHLEKQGRTGATSK